MAGTRRARQPGWITGAEIEEALREFAMVTRGGGRPKKRAQQPGAVFIAGRCGSKGPPTASC